MRNDRHLAIELRKKGKCYNYISKELGIPKSTMCYWFKDLKWSKVIKKDLNKKNAIKSRKRMRIMSKANSIRWEKWREVARQEAKKEFNSLMKDPLFIGALNLYWGEGDNKLENGQVRLANTDPRMIRVFSKFLRKIIKVPVEGIKGSIVLYPDLVENKCRKFWSEAAKIPESRFYKAQFIKGRHPTRRLMYGICTLQVSSRQLKEKIKIWTDLYYKKYNK